MFIASCKDDIDTSLIPVDVFWNVGSENELKMHRIHAYPAKFPSFITTKTVAYAKGNNIKLKKISDIFCGCGTTALEAKRNGLDFWGCDVNPVATLIARVKSGTFQTKRLLEYKNIILQLYNQNIDFNLYDDANDRLKYWYEPNQYNNLSKLKKSILSVVPKDGKYRDFFLCAFSNILKPASKWLARSIKPQIDPNKKCKEVLSLFEKQVNFMIKANEENNQTGKSKSKIEIVTDSILDVSCCAVDAIITSPPYVTSYEYADLHQLSSLWLDYTDDYKSLRNGTIGSKYNRFDFNEAIKKLNTSALDIVNKLAVVDKCKAKSVTKYYLDMQNVARKAYSLLNKTGFALFVIGNTEYKAVKVDNAYHLAESLFDAGFQEVQIAKRKISNKILTPYRDEFGKFSTNAGGRKIYNEEFILIGRK